jgi:hypothetical protein
MPQASDIARTAVVVVERDILPPIVNKLKKEIADLSSRIDALESKNRPAGTGLSAVRDLKAGRKTLRRHK